MNARSRSGRGTSVQSMGLLEPTQAEAAFDAHGELPHLKRFLGLVVALITHPVQAMRCRRLGLGRYKVKL
jgi:hypothetical protein